MRRGDSKRPITFYICLGRYQKTRARTKRSTNTYTDPEWWTKDKGPFKQWVRREEPDKPDPARRLFWSKFSVIPPQCGFCEKYGRKVRYVEGTSLTELVWTYCQKCRYYALRMLNNEWLWFTKMPENAKNPYKVKGKGKDNEVFDESSGGESEENSEDDEAEKPSTSKKAPKSKKDGVEAVSRKRKTKDAPQDDQKKKKLSVKKSQKEAPSSGDENENDNEVEESEDESD